MQRYQHEIAFGKAWVWYLKFRVGEANLVVE